MRIIPWIGLVILPLSLCGGLTLLLPHILHPIAHTLLYGAERSTALLFYGLEKLSLIPLASFHWGINNIWILLMAILGALLLLAPKNFPGRWLGAIYFLPIFFFKPLNLKPGEFNFTLLDVGQGLASVVSTQHHTLVYDTGLKINPDLDSGNLILLPFLYHLNLHHIDTLMVSHGDSDHIGGANSLLSEIRVDRILTSVPGRFVTPHAEFCQAGQHWQWDGVNFNVLFPPQSAYTNPRTLFINNNASCILKVSNSHHSVLLTGDLEILGQNWLLQNRQTSLKTEVLQAPHHGSINAANPAFLTAVKPKYVLFPIGFENRFHFPQPKSLAIYTQTGAKLLNTATNGAITFHFPKSNTPPNIDRYRLTHAHYWTNNDATPSGLKSKPTISLG